MHGFILSDSWVWHGELYKSHTTRCVSLKKWMEIHHFGRFQMLVVPRFGIIIIIIIGSNVVVWDRHV